MRFSSILVSILVSLGSRILLTRAMTTKRMMCFLRKHRCLLMSPSSYIVPHEDISPILNVHKLTVSDLMYY